LAKELEQKEQESEVDAGGGELYEENEVGAGGGDPCDRMMRATSSPAARGQLGMAVPGGSEKVREVEAVDGLGGRGVKEIVAGVRPRGKDCI